MNKFEYAVPQKVADVFTLLKANNSMIKAGGIDVLDLMKESLIEPTRLVTIRDLKELNFIREDSGGAVIGAATTLAELAENKWINGQFRALAQAAVGAATPQIRNAATVGGNLCQRPRCWYFRSHDFPCTRKGGSQCFALDGENQYHAIFGNQDGCVIVHPSATAVALMALGAKLKIVSEKSAREISIEDFFIAPAKDITKENILKNDELISEIIVPKPAKGSVNYYYKQKEKQSFDWPIAEVAVNLTLDGKNCSDARIVLGAAAPVPWRIPKAENMLKNQTITKDLARKASEEAMKDAAPLSQNGYKVDVFMAVITRTICWAAGIDPFK